MSVAVDTLSTRFPFVPADSADPTERQFEQGLRLALCLATISRFEPEERDEPADWALDYYNDCVAEPQFRAGFAAGQAADSDGRDWLSFQDILRYRHARPWLEAEFACARWTSTSA